MTVTDNTHASYVSFPEGQFKFLPRVAYAPDDGTGDGGTPPADEGMPPQDDEKTADDMYGDTTPGDKDGADKPDKDKSDDKPADKDVDSKHDDKGDPAGDDKSDDKDDKDDDKDDADKDKVEVDLKTVPDDGVYTIEKIEGMEIDQKLVDAMSPVWKESGLTHEQVQSMTNVFAEHIASAQTEAAEAWDTTQTEWAATSKADKDFGGDNFDASIQIAADVIEKFGTAELKTALDTSGMGNHPEIIRFIVNIGKSITEDDVPNPSEGKRSAGSKTAEALADDMYGDTTPKKRER